jgi:CheY-like chemotaxis protein
VSKRILFVDDSPLDTELALDALRESGLANDVIAVRDGAEALDYLHRDGVFADRSGGHPAVVLLDLKMPKVDGTEVLRHIKTNPELKQIPVVIMTSSREDHDLFGTYQLGANAYVVKPVKFFDFVSAVQQVGCFWGIVNQPPPGCEGQSATAEG